MNLKAAPAILVSLLLAGIAAANPVYPGETPSGLPRSAPMVFGISQEAFLLVVLGAGVLIVSACSAALLWFILRRRPPTGKKA